MKQYECLALLALLGFLVAAPAVFAWTYTGVNYSISAQDTTPAGIFWDGANWWMVGSATDRVYKYHSNWTYAGVNYSIASQDGVPQDIFWDETYWWMVGSAADRVWQYDSSWAYTGINYSISAQDGNSRDIFWDGTYWWMAGASPPGLRIFKYHSNWTYAGINYSMASQDVPNGIYFDGTYWWMVGSSYDKVYKYYSDWTYAGDSYSVASQDTTPTDIFFDGTYWWMLGSTTDRVYQYSTSLPMTISECPYTITGAGNYILTGNLMSADTFCIAIGANNVVLDCQGYYMTGTPSGNAIDNAGGYDNVTIQNCAIDGFAVGILFQNAQNGSIKNNSISSNDNGIHLLDYSSGNTVTNNNVSSNGWMGIYLDYSSGNTIANNTAISNGYAGIDLEHSCDSNIIANNIAISNPTGGIYFSSSSSNNNLTNNTVGSGDYGINVYGSGNIVANNTATASDYGISVSDSSNILTNNIASSNDYGIYIYDSGNILTNNIANSNSNTGISLGGSNNNLTSNTASSNGNIGISLSGSSHTLANNNAGNNTVWDFYASGSSSNTLVTNLTTQQNIVSFTFKDIALKGLTAVQAPADPTSYANISRYINATNNSATSWLYINISYSGADISGRNESTVGIWRYNGSAWTDSGFFNVQGVDEAANFAYANITTFSPFGVFVKNNVFTAPADSFTSALTANGSIDGALGGGSGYSSSQSVTFLNTTSGRKYLMLGANFSGTNVDFSNLKIEASDSKIAVNTTGVTGLYGTHTLWLPNTNNNGVYVCPNALIVSEVTSGCSGVVTFTGAPETFPQTISGVTVSVDGSYWRISGLTGSGGGENPPAAVPEFSTITLLLALAVVAGGLVLIRRKE